MLEHVPCNLCGADDYAVLYPATVDEYTVADVDLYRQSDPNNLSCRIVKCRRCGLIYANPRERADLLAEIYRDVEDDAYLEIKPAKDASYRWNIERLERWVDRGAVLDVGCGHGFFLSLLDPERWRERVGVEPSRAVARYACEEMGLDVRAIFLAENNLPHGHFDAVTMFHVLEHVANPKADLKLMYELLKPGGYLYLEFPDVSSVFARWRKRSWWYIMRFHTYYYNRWTATRLLAETGFTPVDIHYPLKTWTLGYLAHKLKAYGDHFNAVERAFRRLKLGNFPLAINPHDILGIIARKD